MLLELGRAKIDSLDKLGGTALFNASSSGEANVAILLAMHGADIHVSVVLSRAYRVAEGLDRCQS